MTGVPVFLQGVRSTFAQMNKRQPQLESWCTEVTHHSHFFVFIPTNLVIPHEFNVNFQDGASRLKALGVLQTSKSH